MQTRKPEQKPATVRRIPMTTKLEPSVKAAVKVIAAARGQTPSELVRDYVISGIRGGEPQSKAS